MKVRIGSRDSRLAVIQSEMVIKAIEEYNEKHGLKGDDAVETELITMKTTGDRILDRTLDKVGGKGLFVKELDKALLDGRADLTVHSLKDVPMEVSEDLPLLAFSMREVPRYVLILAEGDEVLNLNLPIGCSSQRRTVQIKKLYPAARVEPVRGNLQTRLKKLDDGQYSALILAYAGIKRLGLEHRVSRIFDIDEMIPAACQGILAVQGRKDFDPFFLADFDDKDARDAALAERSFVRALDGGCSSPVAAYAVTSGDRITITGFYVNDEGETFEKRISGRREDGEKLSAMLAEDMKGDADGR